MAELQKSRAEEINALINAEQEKEMKPVIENGAPKNTISNEDCDEKVVNGDGTQENENEEPEWMDILGSGQIKKKVLSKGEENTRPQSKDICEITYEGRLNDGTVVEKAERLKIHLGDGEVIQGIDLVLALMDEGEKCLLEVGPRFAYGILGHPAVLNYPEVGPNQTLSYTIELHSVQPEPEMTDISIPERKKIGNRKRERGNWWYGRNEFTLAIQSYRRALDYLDEAVGGINYDPKETDEKEDEALKDLLEDRLKVYNNMAAAQLKIGALDAALLSLNNVLRCQPDNVKAIYRKAKILSEKGDVTAAVEALQRALVLEPSNNAVKAELQLQKNKAAKASILERKLYRKMMGSSDSNSRVRGDTDRDSSSRNKLIPWGMVFGSVAVVVAGMVAYRYKFI